MSYPMLSAGRARAVALSAAFACLASSGACTDVPGSNASRTPSTVLAGADAPPSVRLPTQGPELLEGTQASRALGFRLYYRERVWRQMTAVNRLLMSGDLGFSNLLGNMQIAKSGNAFQVSFGPTDNSAMGAFTFNALQAFRKVGGRRIELTLIRALYGLAFLEGVSGVGGLTSREALPNWTLAVDGVHGTVARTRGGSPISPPFPLSPGLEQEIVSTFFNGGYFTYRMELTDYMFTIHPLVRLDQYATMFVFTDLPRVVRISDCCSSWIVSEQGAWAGSAFGNHNSRDNFPDLGNGYIAAMDLADDPDISPELHDAAFAAAEAGRRIGDRVVSAGYAIETVRETGPYAAVNVSGGIRPDGHLEPGGGTLGRLNYCQSAYVAQALSTSGLSWPVPVLTIDAGIPVTDQKMVDLLSAAGLAVNTGGVTRTCSSLDDAFLGGTWAEWVTKKLAGRPWYDTLWSLVPTLIDPHVFIEAFRAWSASMDQIELAAVDLCEYGLVTGKADVYAAARDDLSNLLQLHRIFIALGQKAATLLGDQGVLDEARYQLYVAALHARQYGLAAPEEDLQALAIAETRGVNVEALNGFGDTAPRPLWTDAEIAKIIEDRLARLAPGEPWDVDRYRARFFPVGGVHLPPLKRDGDGYQVIDAFGSWTSLPNNSFVEIGGYQPLVEVAQCSHAPDTISCSWARLGCARGDLDASGTVDGADLALVAKAKIQFFDIVCSRKNRWCNGADIDRSGLVDDEDDAFMQAAQGCVR